MWSVPRLDSDWQLAMHIRVMHGIWISRNEGHESLTECHDSCHFEFEFGHPIAHIHTVEPEEAFTWD